METVWYPVSERCPYYDFVWVARKDGEVLLAYHMEGRFKRAINVGDREFASEWYDDATHWAELQEPYFEEVK